MTVTAIVGAQWGDEGKGRIVDYLAQHAEMVIRFQGGDNAGHTVVNEYGTFRLHLVPSGIFNPRTRCIIGTGTVVNPDSLLEEMAQVAAAGVSLDNLWLSERAQVVMPYHRLLDGLEESARGAATDRHHQARHRPGLCRQSRPHRHPPGRSDAARLSAARLAQALPQKNRELSTFGQPPLALDDLIAQAVAWGETLGPRIVDTLPMVRDAVQAGQEVLLEGQLGVMRDLDWGIYPYVTSSNPIAGGAVGRRAAANRHQPGDRRGQGVFDGGRRRAVPGRVDGRRSARSCGRWGRNTARPPAGRGAAAGSTAWRSLRDVAQRLHRSGDHQAGRAGRLRRAQDLHRLPAGRRGPHPRARHARPRARHADLRDVARLGAPTTAARAWDDLPKAARAYLRRIAELAGVPIRYVSVGAEREQLIVMAA